MSHSQEHSELVSKIFELAKYNPEVDIYLSNLDELCTIRDMSNSIFRKPEMLKRLMELESQLGKKQLVLLDNNSTLLDVFVWILGEVVDLKSDFFRSNEYHSGIRLADFA